MKKENVALKEVSRDLIISKEDFEKYFRKRNIINVEQYNHYIETKSGKSRENFHKFVRLFNS